VAGKAKIRDRVWILNCLLLSLATGRALILIWLIELPVW
jgi:hypothetical protein